MKNYQLCALAVFLVGFIAGCKDQVGRLYPGKPWPDNNGVHINAHGGGFLLHKGVYYWYGEHKVAGRIGNTAQVGVHVYSSSNLLNWQDAGIALKVIENDTTHEITKGCIIERPKVIYNAQTKKFVMWFHLELKGLGYKAARTSVAVADSPTGPFAYLRSFRPHAGIWPMNFPDSLKKANFGAEVGQWQTAEGKQQIINGFFLKRDFEEGQMARDMTLFVDDDGKAYHIHASENNQTLHISELSDDYLSFTGKYVRVLPAGRNEAPAIFKRKGKYVMITSGLTGWKPNAARLSTADHILGPWTSHGNPFVGPDAEITFDAQSTYILPLDQKKDQYIFMADRWEPENPIDGTYIWLPIDFEDELPVLRWYDSWDLQEWE